MEFYDLVNSITIQGDVEVWNIHDDIEEFVFELDDVCDLAICRYPDNFDEHCEVTCMYAYSGKVIIEVRNAFCHGHTRKAFHDAINEVNAAYDAEDYDKYDELLHHYAGMFGKMTADFEDDCTDVRMYGFDIC